MSDESHSAKGLAPAFQHTIGFWLLTFVAGALFLPSALLPVYFEYTAWRWHHAEVRAHLQALQELEQRNEAVIDALRTDPAVNQRVLARDLGYVPPDQEVVTVFGSSPVTGQPLLPSAALPGAAEGARGEPAPLVLKPWEAHLEQRLPRGCWLAVFTEGSSRRVLLIMSAVLLITALAFFPPRRTIA